jgi:hypothetical protein
MGNLGGVAGRLGQNFVLGIWIFPGTVRAMWLSADEQCIIQYLTHCGAAGASAREIARKASTKDRWKEDERWANAPLSALKDKRLVLTSPAGSYILPPKDEKRKLGRG